MRKSGRARKPVQQLNMPAAKENMQRSDSMESAGCFIELDPFAPPPRLSSAGSQSPRATVMAVPSSDFGTPQKSPASAKRMESLPEHSGGLLFEKLSSSGIALKMVIDEWLQMHETSSVRRETVSLVLINLILWASRVEEDIRPEHFVTESASQILADLQDRIQPAQAKTEFPLFDRSRKHRAFRTQFSEFWSMWASSVLPAAKDLELIEKVIMPWLISMSSAGYRPIRYAATLAVLDIVAGCSKACVSMQKELETTSRVMNSKRGMASKRSAEATSARIAEIEKLMQLSIDAVFVQRYRDVDPMIREKCVEKMLVWIETYPEVFLDNAYLRYIGWSLSDKSGAVRAASLNAWKSVCRRPEFRPSLVNFVSRFKSRLLEVLSRDVDKNCRMQAGAVVDSLFIGGFLEDAEMSVVDELILGADDTLCALKDTINKRVFNNEEQSELSAEGALSRLAVFLNRFLSVEASAESNNHILKNFIASFKDSFAFLADIKATTSLLTALIESSEMTDEKYEQMSCLMALLYAQVMSVKTSKNNWHLDHSAQVFNFVNFFVKFINDNEREIYSKDIFYLFALLNEVEVAHWFDVAAVAAWSELTPILTELFCSIDDLESAKMALNFFKRAKANASLKDGVEESLGSGRQMLLDRLFQKIPANMREALKIKDNSLLTLILPLSQMNLLSPLALTDSGELFSILDMTKLVDEFVSIEDVYKTMIWTSSVRLVFHEIMWKLMAVRSNPSSAAFSEILDIRDHLMDLLNPAEYIPEDLQEFSLESFERLSTSINMLADLSLLFAQAPPNAPITWSLSLGEEQVRPLVAFVRIATRLMADPLPARDHESFELARLAKRGYSAMVASIAKLFSLEVLPSAYLSTLFMTWGFGDEVSGAVVRVVLERSLGKMNWQAAYSLISTSLQESYLLAVMSPEYERLVGASTVALAKAFNDQLKQSAMFGRSDEAMLSLHTQAIAFLRQDCAQRSEFMGRVMSQFAVHVSPKHCEELLVAMKGVAYSDSFTKAYCRALERNISKGNVAQRLLTKRTNNSALSSPVAQKSSKLDAVAEEEAELVEDIDTNTQLQDANFEHLPSSPPALLKRKVVHY